MEKIFSEKEVEETLDWIRNMAMNIRNMLPADVVKILYDKWIIIQKSGNADVNITLRIIQDEAINQAYISRDFGTMQRIAELGRDRICKSFYDIVICFCYEEGRSVSIKNREKNE
jgi:hypothetical protein